MMTSITEIERLYDNLENMETSFTNSEREYQWAKLDETDVSDYDNLVPKKDRAIEYDFPLDTFQKRAFLKIFQGEHVFVSAHTSAGKTITAEWAIALSMAKGRKTIYTSPIKALSNQKFRDFRVKFNHIKLDEIYNDNDGYYDHYDDYDDNDGYGGTGGGGGGGYSSNHIYDFDAYQNHKDSGEDERVGIITGDIQLNKTAPCLILTTEILRTMIYDSDPILQELEWVVFDEIHYMNDPERGRVWEEVITLLPEHVNMLFLSATTPNAMEFSEWVGRERQRHVHIVATSKRPIPLEHYLHVSTQDKDLVKYYKSQDTLKSEAMDRLDPKDPDLEEKLKAIETTKFRTTSVRDDVDTSLGESDGTYLVVDRNNQFQELVEKRAKSIINEKRNNNMKSALSFRQSKHQWLSLFKLLQIKKKFPVVVFVFSKKMCGSLSEHLSNSDYTHKREKSHIKVFIDKCLKKLKPEDRVLPQITKTTELLLRGIAIHHGGLLPILKEMTEILFSRCFIRILFATETFAMGINMPTRSVIFSNIQKHDGREFRDLLPGEYTQMSGRAGRRGLDDTGTVIICHWKPSRTAYKTLISGKPLMLTSQFRLTYQTILTMLAKHSIEGGVTGLLRSSFSEFGNNKDAQQVAKMNRLIKQGRRQLTNLEKTVPPEGVKIWEKVNKATLLMYNSLSDLYSPNVFSSLFQVGRHILVYPEKGIYPQAMQIFKATDDYLLATLLKATKSSEATKIAGADASNLPVKINYDWLIALCENITVKQVNKDDDKKVPIVTQVTQVKPINIKHYKLPFTTTNNILNLNEILTSLYSQKVSDQVAINDNDNDNDNDNNINKYSAETLKQIREHKWLSDKITSLSTSASDSALVLYPDYHKKTKLLENIGFIDKEGVLNLKGRIATRINTCHELVLTEFILEAGLSEMTIPQCAALLSCLVASEVKADSQDYRDIGDFDMDLYQRLKSLDEMVTHILGEQQRLNIDIDPDRFKRETFNPSLVKLIYYWASGENFADIMKYTEVMEGTIVRSIMRLDELCQEIIRSVEVIGDSSISEMMEEVSKALRRDIVFCGSLYIATL